jgi:hypothetical protein
LVEPGFPQSEDATHEFAAYRPFGAAAGRCRLSVVFSKFRLRSVRSLQHAAGRRLRAAGDLSGSGGSGNVRTAGNCDAAAAGHSTGKNRFGGTCRPPKYPDAGAPGATLGKPADDGLDDFKNTTGSLGPSGARIDTITDDSEENLARLGDEAFASPMPLRSVAADELADGPLRQTVQSVPSPYLYDHDRHSWLRGVAHYDEFSESWRIVYSRDTADEDDYGGSLTMTGHPDLDKLRDNETILVEGIVDPNRPDRFGKPTYRVRKIRPITPKKATVAEKE